MRNIQQREIGASGAVVGLQLDSLAGAEDRVWPAGWPPIELDAGLCVGGYHEFILESVATRNLWLPTPSKVRRADERVYSGR